MFNMSRIALLASTAILATTIGCARSMGHGTKMDTAAVQKIVKGKTARAEVEARLGPPSTVGLTADGRRTLIYSYQRHDSGALPPTAYIPVVNLFTPHTNTHSMAFQMLQITLTKDDIVEDYHFSDTQSKSQYRGSVFGEHEITPLPVDSK